MPRPRLSPPFPMVALIGVTAIWGYTFVPVQDAVAIYPLFAFLAVRFGISTLVLAPFALALAARPAVARRRSAASVPACSSRPPTACRRPGST